MKSRPTVIDVAAAADVGASTVSRFLRGVPVRSEFAARISTAINKLGYQPDQTARSLRGGRSRTVGVLFPRVSTVYFSQALQCVEILARQRDYIVALLTHGDKLALQQQCLQTLRSCHAEGIILSAAPGTTRTSELIITPLCEAVLIFVAGIAAWVTRQPMIFTSLGPTAFEMVETPHRKSAKPYNVLVGHSIGVAAGFAAMWLTSAWCAARLSWTHPYHPGNCGCVGVRSYSEWNDASKSNATGCSVDDVVGSPR